MLTKEEFIEKLSENRDFKHTHLAVQELDKGVEWTQEERKQLLDIAAQCGQVYGTLAYEGNSRVRDFYREILKNYTGVQDENVDRVIKKVLTIDNEEIYEFLDENKQEILKREKMARVWEDEEHGIKVSSCDGLYHANSVSTSISFIKNKMFYSRQYGEEHFQTNQTGQVSDDSDKSDGIYNDLFFDNCDIRAFSNKHSAYGPISFVMDEKILLDSDISVRITKENPGNAGTTNPFGEKPYTERYFTSIEELNEHKWEDSPTNEKFKISFRTQFGHHTTFWNKSTLKLTPENLKYILLERNPDENTTLQVKKRLEEELAAVGLQNVPVILRKTLPSMEIQFAAPLEVLWELPE